MVTLVDNSEYGNTPLVSTNGIADWYFDGNLLTFQGLPYNGNILLEADDNIISLLPSSSFIGLTGLKLYKSTNGILSLLPEGFYITDDTAVINDNNNIYELNLHDKTINNHVLKYTEDITFSLIDKNNEICLRYTNTGAQKFYQKMGKYCLKLANYKNPSEMIEYYNVRSGNGTYTITELNNNYIVNFKILEIFDTNHNIIDIMEYEEFYNFDITGAGSNLTPDQLMMGKFTKYNGYNLFILNL